MQLKINKLTFSATLGPDMCGVTVTFGCDHRWLFTGSGSSLNTSNTAPRNQQFLKVIKMQLCYPTNDWGSQITLIKVLLTFQEKIYINEPL